MTFSNPLIPNSVEQVTLDPTVLPEKISPALKVGEIFPISVQQIFPNGQGIISLKGQLVSASLPPNSQTGAQLFVQVLDNLEKTVLKILENKPQPDHSPASILQTITKNFSEDLRQLLTSSGKSALPSPTIFSPSSFSLTPVINPQAQANIPPALANTLRDIIASLPTLSQLTDSQKVLQQLTSLTQGTTSATIHDGIATLLVAQNQELHQDTKVSQPELPSQRPAQFLVTIGNELDEILRESVDNNQGASRHLNKLIEILKKALTEDGSGSKTLSPKDGTTKVISTPEKKLIQKLLAELQQTDSSLPEFQADLKAIAKHLSGDANVSQKQAIHSSLTLLPELRETIGSLNQLTVTQDALNQINPLMQSLGEPALLLLPFVFQNTVFQNEISIFFPGAKKKKNTDEETNQDNFNEASKNTGNNTDLFQRIQFHVPLPTLGNIEVDVAHRPTQILIRFTLEDPEANSFLVQQLPKLVSILQSRGFENAELTSATGTPKDILPFWASELHPETSVMA